MSKRYYWLKLKEDFFRQPKIKKLRKIAGGDTYTIIYLKMQLLSIKQNGTLFFEGIEDSFEEEIALTLDEDVENVKIAVAYLKAQGLLEEVDAENYSLPEAKACLGSETDAAERKRRSRENQKLCLEQKENCDNLTPLSQDVTRCHIEIEKEIEKNTEKEIEKEIEKEKKEKNNYQLIADLYNQICISFPKVKKLSEQRKKAIKARLRVYSLDDFKILFEMAEQSDFLKGINNRNWSADFDWLLNDTNIVKVLEGKYNNRKENIVPVDTGKQIESAAEGLVAKAIKSGISTEFEGF